MSLPPYCKDKNAMSRNVGYWQSWSVYRDESCNLFTPESIDASSYTHIVYSFAAIARDGTLDAWNSTEEIERINLYKRFLDVKDKYPTTKFAGECCSSKNTSRNICYIFHFVSHQFFVPMFTLID